MPYKDGKPIYLTVITEDSFLIRRITGPNRLLRNAPELEPQITATLLANDDESLTQLVDDLELARQLYSPEREKPINRVLSCLNLLESINCIRADLPQENAGHFEPRLNIIFELSYRKLATSFAEEQLNDAQLTIDYLMHRAALLYGNFLARDQVQGEKSGGTGAIENLRIRLRGLYGAILSCNDAYKYAEGLSDDRGESVSTHEAEEDTHYIAALFQDIRASQDYGVKMGYISEDDLGGALIFSPVMSVLEISETEKLRSIYHPLLDKANAVAQILHTQRRHHRRIKATVSEEMGYTSIGFDDLGPAGNLALGRDGELYTWRDCKINLRDIALKKGNYQAYRELQAKILSHYYDLTHRLDEVQRVQKALREHPPLIDPGTRPALESIERLVTPRVRKYTPDVTHNTGSLPTADDEPIRTFRYHDVTWHTRKLPSGWKPSPAALGLAERLGVELEPGETIVKEHTRGSLELGRVTAHRFVERPKG